VLFLTSAGMETLMGTRHRALSGVAALLALAVAPAAAQANAKTVGDGNDVATALDIRSVSHGHRGARLTHSIRTYGAFSSRFLSGDNFFVFVFDTDGTRSTAERFVVVFWGGGRLRAAVTRGNGDFIRWTRVSRPSSHSVKVTLRRGSLGNPPGYRWVAVSVVGQRGDSAPNRGLILHDIRAPRIRFPKVPIPAALTYDVAFSVSDSGGSGLRRWRLQQRDFGTSTWATIRSGTSGGSKSPPVTAAEGDDDQYRVIAVDRHGNRRVSRVRTVSLPVDDASAGITYVATLGGAWTPQSNLTGPFLGTLHTTSTTLDSFTYTFDGTYIAIVGPDDCVQGTLVIDNGASVVETSPCAGGQRRILFSRSVPDGPHTATFTFGSSDTGSFSLDGIISR
jgi:hypothetical protein